MKDFTIMIDLKIWSSTIMEYLLAVNEHYKSQGFNEPSNRNNRFPASNLLDSAEESEGASAKRDPLNHKMIVLMG